MYFKSVAGHIFGVKLNKAEERALNAEISKQIIEKDRQYDIDRDSLILYILQTEFGFGPKRLYRAWKLIREKTEELRARYELPPDDDGWLCRLKLKEAGCDVEAWYRDENSG